MNKIVKKFQVVIEACFLEEDFPENIDLNSMVDEFVSQWVQDNLDNIPYKIVEATEQE